MKELCDCTWNEGAESVLMLLPRLTVLRGMLEEKPVRELMRCAEAITHGDIRTAVDACFSMTGALLSGGCRRISGDLFKDLLLDAILLKPHPFALMASSGLMDEALYNAMRDDLEVLSSLRTLDGGTLYRFIQERYKEIIRKRRPGRDNAVRLAEAAWGGSAVRPPEDDQEKPIPGIPAFLPQNAPSWHYGEEELRDSFVSDEALEEMYHRFLEGEIEWPRMVEDLWNFFSAYGTGVFLKNRQFYWDGKALLPMEELRLAENIPFFDKEYRASLDHLIEFMRGEDSEPMLILGPKGMGKTTMLFSLADELPELRFVYVNGRDAVSLEPLFEILREQPLKFLVAIDDAPVFPLAVRTLPVNVMLFAAAEEAPSPAFTKRVSLDMLKLDGFTAIVQRFMEEKGVLLPREAVRSACVDHQVDSNGDMTVAAAAALANFLAR